ncbi:MAG: TipAS antibiotic-recognition domain-containing protein [Oscillibacter sp.]|jgi:hypothetical protein|nr:TipAS antibiotic-recognition domain-containing protein [Oscillibacter sp.]
MSNYIGAEAEQQEEDELLVAFAKEAKKDDPESAEAQALVVRWKEHMAKFHEGWDDERLRRMGFMYGADDRFLESMDSYGEGTAHFMSDAIAAYLENK